MQRATRGAADWPEMDEIGTPAFEDDDQIWLDQGATWELPSDQPAQPPSDHPIAVLWVPAPGQWREYFIYAPDPPAEQPAPEPERPPLGFRKAHAR